MLNISKEDVVVRELEYDYNSGDFKYEFEYRGEIVKGSKRLYGIDDLMDEDCDNLMQVEFINIIRKLKKGYGSIIYIIANLDLIDENVESILNSIDSQFIDY